MHKSFTIGIVMMIFLLCFASIWLTGCPWSNHDGTVCHKISPPDKCYYFGEPFTPPHGVTDPWKLRASDYCCDVSAEQIVIARSPGENQCIMPNPLQFMCIGQNGDGSCKYGENFCTSPIDCPPPNGNYALCCEEGQLCKYSDGNNPPPPSGVTGCCPGLEMLPLDFWDEGSQSCAGLVTDIIVCVRKCGDGQCTTGENACICPQDCVPSEC